MNDTLKIFPFILAEISLKEGLLLENIEISTWIILLPAQ